MKRYQVAKLESLWKGDPQRWNFIAHGATMDEAEALEWKATLEARGVAVMLLPLPDDGE